MNVEIKEQMYEGKAKQVFATSDPEIVMVHYKDDATAGDGEKKGTIDGSFPGGWGSYAETKVCSRYGEPAKHTVEIKPAPGCEDKGCDILALMVS